MRYTIKINVHQFYQTRKYSVLSLMNINKKKNKLIREARWNGQTKVIVVRVSSYAPVNNYFSRSVSVCGYSSSLTGLGTRSRWLSLWRKASGINFSCQTFVSDDGILSAYKVFPTSLLILSFGSIMKGFWTSFSVQKSITFRYSFKSKKSYVMLLVGYWFVS